MALGIERITDDGADHVTGPAGEPRNGFERMRRRRAVLHQHNTRQFAIPGYQGRIVVQYERMTVEDFDRAIYGVDEPRLDKNIQFLIDACQEILERDDDDELHPMVTERFTQYNDLWPVSELDPATSTVRELVLDIFGGNEEVLCQHAEQVANWMISAHEADDDAFVGGL